MAAAELSISCPCCGAQLRVDPQTGKVAAAPAAAKPKDLSEVVTRVQGRSAKVQDSFSAALDAERRRKQELEDLFKKAQDKVKTEGPDPSRPDSPLDDRWR